MSESTTSSERHGFDRSRELIDPQLISAIYRMAVSYCSSNGRPYCLSRNIGGRDGELPIYDQVKGASAQLLIMDGGISPFTEAYVAYIMRMDATEQSLPPEIGFDVWCEEVGDSSARLGKHGRFYQIAQSGWDGSGPVFHMDVTIREGSDKNSFEYRRPVNQAEGEWLYRTLSANVAY